MLDFLVVLVAACSFVQSARPVNPTLVCSCTSTHFEDTRFNVKCRRNSNGEGKQPTSAKRPGVATPFKLFFDKSSITCEERPVPPPSPGYEKVKNLGYYKLHTNYMTWYEARATCAEEGAHLAIVHSQEEADLLKRMFVHHTTVGENPSYKDKAFIGASDLNSKGEYDTIFGEPLSETGYLQWAPGEPSNLAGGENCIAIQRDGKFSNELCDTYFRFFCEQKL